ncbi:Poly-beta-1,6-N-acetyl-D-glucosamine synthase [Frondihabitans sp. 762G35]|uniref:glycosyltransferase family 2 protein n=1 Tax=Frondihabitans sp. 762G35 TaxID=1446794 RepID=UPI000D208480|nr:glycosyltransferase family 2 protein [Frondihabitans sp. 762G35]ARC56060.1 Poly-beta-1,6-N-acetyl-D-glucosamine synthase [Frondihabitans sp. 762G35]
MPVHALPPARKRQWGSERRTTPLPTIHARPSDRKVAYARIAIISTIMSWVAYVVSTILRQFMGVGADYGFTLQAVSYLVIVTFLTFSALMYLVARLGALTRFTDHVRVPRAELDRHFTGHASSMTVLVPSYAEEPQVVRQTLWSAALQEYPSLRVVLLLDDPPHPADPHVASRLDATRTLGEGIMRALAEPATRFTVASDAFAREHGDAVDEPDARPALGTAAVDAIAVRELAGHYDWAATWLRSMADAEAATDHVDEFFATQILRGLADEFELVANALVVAANEGEAPALARMSELYRRLVWTFQAEVTVFERKLYSSLSHEANKAMNLNSYIGLMGGSYRQESAASGIVLRRVSEAHRGDLVIPDSEYLLTLDADSLLLRDYCLRLVHLLEEPGNERVAVTQTPYSSFRGAGSRIERLAGATTDLQHVLHQGMSHFGAAFWVGANAVIRKRALEDIVEKEMVGGFEVRRYVQDRTVIEDTESSIDLGTHGWSIVNYPERLSYSATPPDFGSLIVQRRRWANGGLLILPKLIRQASERRRAGSRMPLTEMALRINYMGSIAWASVGLVLMLAFPYDSRLLSPFVLLAALPYFLAMASDLRSAGYKRSDVLRIYGFNLILLPVQLAGVLKSIQQAITGKKIPFARTPKVKNRTAAPVLYVLAPYGIVLFSVATLYRDYLAHNWGNAAFAAFNAVLATWAIFAYLGLWNSLVDVWLGLTDWLYVEKLPRGARKAAQPVVAELDWRSVLYHGREVAGETPRDPAPADLETARRMVANP